MYENKQKVLKNIDNGTCPKCARNTLFLDEKQDDFEAMVCRSCKMEVIINFKQTMDNVMLYDPEIDKEIEIMDKGEVIK
ncbi:unnamed protein product [marine sediment metagenome]|uniref:Uncharacterized protein n=1 Tax=marine sediment metagenome TaxID=412755 RepID=X1UX19_9ZZZZ